MSVLNGLRLLHFPLIGLLAVVGASSALPGAAIQQIPTQSITNAEHTITNFGKRPGAVNSQVHIFPTINGYQTLPAVVRNRNNFYGVDPKKLAEAAANEPATTPPPPFPAPGKWNPLQLVTNGGFCGAAGCNYTGVASMGQENIYLNCAAHNDSCWGDGTAGNITGIQHYLSTSPLFKIMNQYVGSTAPNRYPLQQQWWAAYSLNQAPWNASKPVLLDSTAQAIALAASNGWGSGGTGGGYGHEFHIFVPPGTDACFDASYTACYSPDHGSTFYFCGYHGSFDSGGQHYLYSVEPYDNVGGCIASGMSANGAQISVLSHELAETITDPDPNWQWNTPKEVYGEIGDACAWHIYHVTLKSSPLITTNVQLEYSNV